MIFLCSPLLCPISRVSFTNSFPDFNHYAPHIVPQILKLLKVLFFKTLAGDSWLYATAAMCFFVLLATLFPRLNRGSSDAEEAVGIERAESSILSKLHPEIMIRHSFSANCIRCLVRSLLPFHQPHSWDTILGGPADRGSATGTRDLPIPLAERPARLKSLLPLYDPPYRQ